MSSVGPGSRELPTISATGAEAPPEFVNPSTTALKLLQRVGETWGRPEHPVDWVEPALQRRWEYETTIKLLGVPAGSRVLDAGGGGGYLSYILSDLYKVVYNDRHDTYNQPAAPVQKIIGSFFTLLEDHLFDAIACVSVLEHVPHEKRAAWFDKVCRLLRPGGSAVLTFEWHPTEVFDIKDGFTLTTEQLAKLYDSDQFHVTAQLISPTRAPNSRGWLPVVVKLVRR